ncbi:MAG TPA: 5-oxoprolinase subunit PxpB [Gemmatimonadaceae bacterium]|jgi:inhibitor of KinA|nr:5-oxoprolinase subunit PxpB [Gemmatimonadaceae bacterium]
MSGISFSPLGDRAVIIRLGSSIDEATHRRVRAVCARLDAQPIPGVVEYVPAFASVAVHYDPATNAYARMTELLDAELVHLEDEGLPPARTVEIPVCYGGEFGPDLDDVARHHALTADEVVRIHTGGDYLVHMIGFAPGFPYLGGLPERIATPRRREPRTLVPAGSVGIGGSQTGVYPIASPGGWQLIGRTPLTLFSPERDVPALLRAGDRVRFRAISRDEFLAWDADA